MRSWALGSVAAAIVMFALAFVLYGVLGMQSFNPLDPQTAGAVQTALGGTLHATGTYIVPQTDQGWTVGPGAVVNFVVAGGAPKMAPAMIEGFLQIFVSALLMASALLAVGGDFARQARVLFWFAIGASFFMHLADPIWFGFAWRNSLYVFVCDAAILIAGGLVLARWFTSARDVSVSAAAAAPAE